METRRQGDKETTNAANEHGATTLPSSPRPLVPLSPCPWFRPLLASCFGLGYSPIMPGTCGALLGPAIYIPLAMAVPDEPLQTALIAVALLAWCWITVALGGWAETYYQKKDSQIFVTDEVAGFLMTILLFHITDQPVLTTLWAFPMTRIIDILKIPPARRLEKLPRGWGVLADDLLGSVYAAGVLHLVRVVMPGWFTISAL